MNDLDWCFRSRCYWVKALTKPNVNWRRTGVGGGNRTFFCRLVSWNIGLKILNELELNVRGFTYHHFIRQFNQERGKHTTATASLVHPVKLSVREKDIMPHPAANPWETDSYGSLNTGQTAHHQQGFPIIVTNSWLSHYEERSVSLCSFYRVH